ncbi:acyltransferase [Leptospira kanakyensis]|nr:acyltransferase [Leptospira kanakyensis]MCW7482125.1 acyltransferase [Leptospira kanakyensis]
MVKILFQRVNFLVFRVIVRLKTFYVRIRYFQYFLSIGKGSRFYKLPDFDPDFRNLLLINVGNDTVFNGVVSFRGRGLLNIGNNCSFNNGIIFGLTCDMKIGDYVMVADNVSFRTADHKFTEIKTPIMYQGEISKSIDVKEDVWIGCNATILKGVTIEKGSIVGANSVVTKDIAPYSIVGGVPAKLIKKRV